MANSIPNGYDSSRYFPSYAALYPTLKSASQITNECLALSANNYAPGDNLVPVPAALVPIPNDERLNPQDGLGQEVLVLYKTETTFGRNFCDYSLISQEISRKHAAIKYENGHWWIVDLDSTNGILVNAVRLLPGTKKMLHERDSICFGPVEKGCFKYTFCQNYSQSLFPCAPLCDTVLVDPNGYDSAPTQDATLSDSEQMYRSENDALKSEKNNLEMRLKREQQLSRTKQRKLDEKDKKIESLNSKLKKYRTLADQLEKSSQHSAKSVSSSEDESSDHHEHQCNAIKGGKVSGMLREITCSICSEFLVSPTSLSCSHVFCLHCIDQWKDEYRSKYNSGSNGICPVCRKEVQCQTQVLAFENVIELVLDSVLSNQEKEDRRKLVELRKQRKAAANSASSQQFSPASLGSFLQQILNGFPRSRRSSIVITSDESDDDDDDDDEEDHEEDSDEQDRVVEISVHGEEQDRARVEVDLDLSDVDEEDGIDISITVRNGNSDRSFDIQLQEMIDVGSSGDEIVIDDDSDSSVSSNSNDSQDVYYYIDDTESNDAIIISDSEDEPTSRRDRRRQRRRRSSMIILSDSEDSMPAMLRNSLQNGGGQRSAQIGNADSAAVPGGSNSLRRNARESNASRRSHPYRRNGGGPGRINTNNNLQNNNANRRATMCV